MVLFSELTLLRIARACLLAAVVLTLSCTAALAQPRLPSPSDLTTTGTSYYVFVEIGEPTMEILVTGAAKTGVYQVGTQTSLLKLLALAGGIQDATLETDEIIVTASVEVRRRQGDEMQLLYAAAPDQLLIEPGRHPILQSGDLILLDVVTERIPSRVSFRDVLDVSARIASLVSVVLIIATRL